MWKLMILAILVPAILPGQAPGIRTVGAGDVTSISRDGRYYTFTDWNTGKIMLGDIRSGEARALTPGGYPDYGMYSQISPDGDTVAYGWRVPAGGGEFDLRLVRLDGSQPAVLRDGAADEDSYFPMDWSPDGLQILARASKRLVLVSAEDGAIREVHSFEERVVTNWARFSPDGSLIAFDFRPYPEGPPGDILIYSLEHDRVIASIDDPADERLIGWSPDREWLLFFTQQNGKCVLSAAPVRGEEVGDPVLLLDSVGQWLNWLAGVTSDGSLVYGARVWDSNLYLADYDAAAAALGGPTAIASDVNYNSAVAWSPDGQRLVYSRSPLKLVVRSFPDGAQNEIDVGLQRYHTVGPHWSEDGRSILVGARPGGGAAYLVRADVDTDAVTPLLPNDRDGVVEWAVGSPTGIAYFPRYRLGEMGRIVKRDMATGREEVVYSFESRADGRRPLSHLALSTDGSHLAFLEQEYEPGTSTATTAALAVLELSSGKSRRLFETEEGQVLYQPAWTPDGQYILFGLGAAGESGSELQIWRLDVQTGAVIRLSGVSLPNTRLNGLSVHPGGRRIAFTTAEGGGYRDEVRVIDNIPARLELER